MTVKELVDQLGVFEPDSQVFFIYRTLQGEELISRVSDLEPFGRFGIAIKAKDHDLELQSVGLGE